MLYYYHKIKTEVKIMKRIFNSSLNLLSKAVAMIVLFVVSTATGTISWLGPYEPEMPPALKPKDSEEAS
jgi:cyclic lactone autoinducer peptide